MYQISDFNKSAYRVNEVAKMLGVTTKTIRNYDKEGKLRTIRSEGNHRMILREDIIALLQKKGLIVDETVYQKRDVIYALRDIAHAIEQGYTSGCAVYGVCWSIEGEDEDDEC